MTVLVFANGDLESIEWVRQKIARATAVIAADGGADHVLAAGGTPDVIIGDLDSFPDGKRAALEADGVAFVLYSAAKDETDLELALLFAVETYDEPIDVVAGLGGRLDQLLANILLLLHPTLYYHSIRFSTPYQTIWLIHGETEVRGEPGDTVSLIPLGGDVHVRATTGLAWPLQDEVLAVGPARGVSNQMTGDRASISVASGDLLCVHTTREWGR